MRKPTHELLFLHTLNMPVELHRSQFYEFSRQAYEFGIFEKYDDGKGNIWYGPKQNFFFTRQYFKNKRPGKVKPYLWRPQNKHPDVTEWERLLHEQPAI